jgi:hypothetical protein
MVMLLAACTPGPGSSPAESPFGDNPAADLAQIPQSVLAQVDLGEAGPGIRGSGGSFSYDSDLDPTTTLRAYAAQLVRAGFREVAIVDLWHVFVGPRLTVWIQTASGPPTSLLVVVRPTGAADVIRPYPRPTESAPRDVAGGVAGNPNPASRPVPVRRPDPPHAGAPVAGGSGGSSDGAVAGGDDSGTGTGSGTGSGTGAGTGSGNGAAGGAGTGSGGGSGSGGYGGSGPRP